MKTGKMNILAFISAKTHLCNTLVDRWSGNLSVCWVSFNFLNFLPFTKPSMMSALQGISWPLSLHFTCTNILEFILNQVTETLGLHNLTIPLSFKNSSSGFCFNNFFIVLSIRLRSISRELWARGVFIILNNSHLVTCKLVIPLVRMHSFSAHVC